ncbi:MAG: hypothetical protein WC356_04945 [Candidatus Micrarchaeia archaeon]|jgi:hypothetical protein
MWIDKIKDTKYYSLIKEMQKKDEELLNAKDEDSILYSSELIPNLTFPLFEPRTAFSTPVKYFQDLFINDEKWPFVWRHNSTRAIGFENEFCYLISKHIYPDETSFSHYLFLKLNKKEIKITKNEDNSICLGFEGNKEVYNYKTKEKIYIKIQFNFIQKPFHKTQIQRAQNTALYKNTYRGGNIIQAASKFEDYIITVPHFSPHPYLLNEYEKLGFTKRSDMQKAVYDYLKGKF